jgi:hypothetical protein
LVKSWLAEGPYNGNLWGEKSRPYADFSQIRFGEYLEPLTEKARGGNQKALVGVGSIATPEATRVLIDLLDFNDEEFRKNVCQQLAMRLPDPYLKGGLGKRNPFEDGMDEPRRWLVEKSWREEFTNDVRKAGSRFLEGSNKDWAATGAYMLECCGVKSDTPIIIAALNREVQKTMTGKMETGIYPRPQGACQELQRAAKMMLRRGAAAPENPVSPGECILYVLALKNNEAFRPKSWIQTCDRLLQSNIPYIQENTLIALPVPMPKVLHKHLKSIMKSGNIDASIEACRIVERDKLANLKEPVLEILKTSNEEWLFRAASNTARALDAKYERIQILVSRMDEPDMLFKCLDELKTIFDNAGGGSANSNIDLAAAAKRIKPKWTAFIKKHENYLKAGKKFTLPHPELTEDMFPQDYFITLHNGKSWPQRDFDGGVPRDETSVSLGESKFRLIREVNFQGHDLFDLAIQAGMYKRKGTEYLPGDERGAVSVGGKTWHGSNGVGLVAYDPHMRRYQIYYFQDQAIPGHHLDIVYADEDFIFFTYGYHRDLPDIRPSLEVYSLKHQRFACLAAVSTLNAKLGRFSMKTLEATNPKMIPPSMGWDDSSHADKKSIELSDAGLFRPDSVVLDGEIFSLRYHTGWGIEEFLTVLQFKKVDLLKELDRVTSNKSMQVTSQ